MGETNNTEKVYPMVITGEIIEDTPEVNQPVQTTTALEPTYMPYAPVQPQPAVTLPTPKGEGLGVAGLVFSFSSILMPLLLPLSFLFSVWGLSTAKRTGGNTFFARFGLWVSIIVLSSWLVLFAVGAVNLLAIETR